ncbi:SAM-dependent methyltransferase [Kitasatospora nipponensis]|uniref:S-adenosyl-L-methionine-dependent methyltransferase n=1 Tax=Kitasatospora nipponensis TaxID=258049 RepID=A0ABP4HH47_9ACTN
MVNNGQPSRTALMAAAARAAHLLVDDSPAIFADPLARTLLGERAEELLGYHRSFGEHPLLCGTRTTVTTRSRYTEDRLAALAARGLDQYVILGAGLDSFAYRSELAHPVTVFEVDEPATQAWKRDLLASTGTAVPPSAVFVPVDFERDGARSLTDRLVRAGFDPGRPALVSWLGVTMYLTREAIGRTLAAVSGFAPGSELIVEHFLPAELRDEAGQSYAEMAMAATAEQGEPWRTFLSVEQLDRLLVEHRLQPVEYVPQRETLAPADWQRTDALRPLDLPVLARARVPARQVSQPTAPAEPWSARSSGAACGADGGVTAAGSPPSETATGRGPVAGAAVRSTPAVGPTSQGWLIASPRSQRDRIATERTNPPDATSMPR